MISLRVAGPYIACVQMCLKALTHVTISSTMAFNVAKISSSARIVTKSSTISLRVAGPYIVDDINAVYTRIITRDIRLHGGQMPCQIAVL